MVHYGLGRHLADVDEANVLPFFTILFTVYFTYDTALVLLKASALLFYARIFLNRQYSTSFTYSLYVVHALNIAWFVGIVLSSAFMCKPIAKSWNPFLEGTCGSTPALWLGSAIPSVVIDLIILMLPLPMIWTLKMSIARKSGITAIFVCGYWYVQPVLRQALTAFLTRAQRHHCVSGSSDHRHSEPETTRGGHNV
jgi:hypothetical protein